MARNTKIVLALVALLILFVAGLLVMQARRSAAQTEEAMATVAAAELEVKKGQDDTIVTVEFEPGGAAVRGRARLDGDVRSDYPPGRPVRICFDPANPSSLRIDDESCR